MKFELSRARDLDLGSGHMAYRRASLIDLYLYTKFHSNRRNFLWTDGRTDGRTFSPLSNIIRSTFGSRPNNLKHHGHPYEGPDLWPPNSPDLNPADHKICVIVWGHVESRVHFVMKASHLTSYVKGSLRFPKMVVGTLGNVWDSYSNNLKVELQ